MVLSLFPPPLSFLWAGIPGKDLRTFGVGLFYCVWVLYFLLCNVLVCSRFFFFKYITFVKPVLTFEVGGQSILSGYLELLAIFINLKGRSLKAFQVQSNLGSLQDVRCELLSLFLWWCSV